MSSSIRDGRKGRAGRPLSWALQALAVAAMAACGGGGGGSTSTTTPETPQANTPTIEALPSGTRAFHVKVDASWADPSVIETQAGGTTQIGWNMADIQRTMTPGMKLAFFGRTPSCGAEFSDGPVVNGDATEFETVRSRTGVAVDALTDARRWTPTAPATGCDSQAGRTGPQWMYLNPSDSAGGLGVYTATGPDAQGNQPFMMPTGHAGSDGNGYNANGIANFVAFRHAWYASDAVRPWRDSSGNTVEARFLSRQSVGAMEVGAASSGVVSQVKQQVMFTVINTTCIRTNSTGAPCHVQYLFNTAAARAGVTDWESWSPSTSAHIWFDADQGSLPIIDGMVPAAGKGAAEGTYGQTLYRSAGYTSQHTTFGTLTFDIRVSFDELLVAVRLLTAQRLGITLSAVTDAQVAQLWGADWANTDKWTLISTTFGQEAHNSEFETRRSWIGGGMSELYAGPAK